MDNVGDCSPDDEVLILARLDGGGKVGICPLPKDPAYFLNRFRVEFKVTMAKPRKGIKIEVRNGIPGPSPSFVLLWKTVKQSLVGGLQT